MEKPQRMSLRSRLRVAGWALFGTLGCVVVSVSYNWATFRDFGPEVLGQALASATVLPILLAFPLFTYLSVKLRELAVANHRLNDLASHDSLTGCLNRYAFTTLVERHLDRPAPVEGALLMVDADHFKSINDRFGHDRGDEALALIGGAIRSALRKSDAVGRLGGEEFGIHLPKADDGVMASVAERIRLAVASARFRPGGVDCRLTVSVGGVAYAKAASFQHLYRIADQNLYAAKKDGRNRVRLASSPSLAPDLACAMESD